MFPASWWKALSEGTHQVTIELILKRAFYPLVTWKVYHTCLCAACLLSPWPDTALWNKNTVHCPHFITEAYKGGLVKVWVPFFGHQRVSSPKYSTPLSHHRIQWCPLHLGIQAFLCSFPAHSAAMQHVDHWNEALQKKNSLFTSS